MEPPVTNQSVHFFTFAFASMASTPICIGITGSLPFSQDQIVLGDCSKYVAASAWLHPRRLRSNLIFWAKVILDIAKIVNNAHETVTVKRDCISCPELNSLHPSDYIIREFHRVFGFCAKHRILFCRAIAKIHPIDSGGVKVVIRFCFHALTFVYFTILCKNYFRIFYDCL